MKTQTELRKHCVEVLGMSEENIGDEEIPQGIIHLGGSEGITEEDMEWAEGLSPSINK